MVACENGRVPESFARRFTAVRSVRGPLVFGLDPSAVPIAPPALQHAAPGAASSDHVTSAAAILTMREHLNAPLD